MSVAHVYVGGGGQVANGGKTEGTRRETNTRAMGRTSYRGAARLFKTTVHPLARVTKKWLLLPHSIDYDETSSQLKLRIDIQNTQADSIDPLKGLVVGRVRPKKEVESRILSDVTGRLEGRESETSSPVMLDEGEPRIRCPEFPRDPEKLIHRVQRFRGSKLRFACRGNAQHSAFFFLVFFFVRGTTGGTAHFLR